MNEYMAWIPEIFLTIAGIGLFCFDLLVPSKRSYVRHLALLSLAAMIGLSVWVALTPKLMHAVYFEGSLKLDDLTTYGRLLFGFAGILVVFASWNFYGDQSRSEYYGLLLFSLLGGMVIISSQTLLMLFLGIELLAIPTYAMTAILKKQDQAVEAGLKYFLLGTFASIVMLFGMALLYGSLGTISYVEPLFKDPAALSAAKYDLLLFAFFFLFMGIGYKIVAFPFHFWSPDVYAGGSTPVVAYISTMPKVAIILAVFRILGPDFAANYPSAQLFLGILALFSMTYGNLVALMQDDLRRMLAYSGIANTGYAMIALVAGGGDAYAALMFFLMLYTFGNLGAFFVVLGVSGQERSTMRDFAGLGKRSPYLAMAMGVFMFSLAGTPPLAGFFGKFALFKAAVEQGFWYLALAGLLNSVISLGYYLKVTQQMYISEPEVDIVDAQGGAATAGLVSKLAIPASLNATLALTIMGTLLLGIVGISFLARLS
ncbi:MAG: NADH-quinone oxidoreductase subunit N [Candidatus Aquicultorales bacterium]